MSSNVNKPLSELGQVLHEVSRKHANGEYKAFCHCERTEPDVETNYNTCKKCGCLTWERMYWLDS